MNSPLEECKGKMGNKYNLKRCFGKGHIKWCKYHGKPCFIATFGGSDFCEACHDYVLNKRKREIEGANQTVLNAKDVQLRKGVRDMTDGEAFRGNSFDIDIP